MPVTATTHPEKAPSSNATSWGVISPQLQERLRREERLADFTRRIEQRAVDQALLAGSRGAHYQST